MNRKSNPWVALVALILLLVLVVCTCTGCDDTARVEDAIRAGNDRFEVEIITRNANGISAVLTDTETGVQYIYIKHGHGIALTKLEEGE